MHLHKWVPAKKTELEFGRWSILSAGEVHEERVLEETAFGKKVVDSTLFICMKCGERRWFPHMDSWGISRARPRWIPAPEPSLPPPAFGKMSDETYDTLIREICETFVEFARHRVPYELRERASKEYFEKMRDGEELSVTYVLSMNTNAIRLISAKAQKKVKK